MDQSKRTSITARVLDAGPRSVCSVSAFPHDGLVNLMSFPGVAPAVPTGTKNAGTRLHMADVAPLVGIHGLSHPRELKVELKCKAFLKSPRLEHLYKGESESIPPTVLHEVEVTE